VERKVIRLANRTLVVSLPKRWVDRANVKKGDSVEVVEKEHELLIRAKRDEKKKSVSVDVSKMPSRFVERRLLSAWYRAGVPDLRVTGPRQKLEVIERSASQFIGVISVDQDSNSILLRNVAILEDNDVERVFKKTFWLVEEFCSQIAEGMKKNSLQTVSGEQMRVEIQRHTGYCRSVLNAASGKTVRETNELFFMLSTIDTIAELLVRSLKSNDKNSNNKKSSLLAFSVRDLIHEARFFVTGDGSLENCYIARERVHDAKPARIVCASDSYLILVAKLIRDVIESKVSMDFR
jgi:antitoxin component of MazEF toxin-antitoxin module